MKKAQARERENTTGDEYHASYGLSINALFGDAYA